MRTSIDTEKILASLTALGATLLGAASAQAAQITVGSDVTVLAGVPSASFTLALPGSDTFIVQGVNRTSLAKDPRWISMKAIGYGKVKTVENASARWSSVLIAQPGQKFSALGGDFSTNGILAGNTSKHSHQAFSAGHYTNAYFDFVFKDTTNGSQVDYGWIELSLLHNGYTNLDVQIVAYAWEPDGQQLGAGVSPSDAPEPASGPLGGMALGAMVLGAAGIRRWKTARPSQVN